MRLRGPQSGYERPRQIGYGTIYQPTNLGKVPEYLKYVPQVLVPTYLYLPSTYLVPSTLYLPYLLVPKVSACASVGSGENTTKTKNNERTILEG